MSNGAWQWINKSVTVSIASLAIFAGDESAASERRASTHSASPLWCCCESGIRLASRSIYLRSHSTISCRYTSRA